MQPITNFENTPIEDITRLNAMLKDSNAGILTIKPRILFKMLEQRHKSPVPMDLYVPSSGIGSVTLLEAAILISMINVISPQKIFEFGTFLGYSTSFFLKNSDKNCEVYSIDLGTDGAKYSTASNYTDAELHSDHQKNDDYLRYSQNLVGTHYLQTLTEQQQARLGLLKGDSRLFDVDRAKLKNAVDFIFIDGGHDFQTIKSDTQKAREMASSSGVIFWHDYSSSIHKEVTQYLQGEATQRVFFHVQHTLLAFELFGEAKQSFLKSFE